MHISKLTLFCLMILGLVIGNTDFAFGSLFPWNFSRETPKDVLGLADTQTEDQEKYPENVLQAVAVLEPSSGSDVRGMVVFTKVSEGVLIEADIEGLTPGKHGFHVHEHGDCSAADASSAGGHFNPTNTRHGGPDSKERHVGDLGNLDADLMGYAHYERVDSVIQLSGPHSIIGKSIIVHADEDDLVSQPTGNAGARIACGLIEMAREY